MKKLNVTALKCVGCKLCELNCAFAHHGMFSHDIANVHVISIEDKADFTPYMCVQCDERSCVNACPVQALSVNESTGAIALDRDACIECGVCVEACAHQGIRFVTLSGEQRLAVCDLCDGAPRCAGACREQAIRYE